MNKILHQVRIKVDHHYAIDSAARQRQAQHDELAAADLAGRAGIIQTQKLIGEEKKKKAADLTAAELTGELRFKLRLEEEGESVDSST